MRFLSYFLSKTWRSCAFAPVAVVPVESTVVTFPSFETETLDVPITLSPFFRVATKWLESVRLAEMVSAPLGIEPEMGLSLPSN